MQKVKIDDVLKYEQPTKYIVESENYNNDFKTPVLTAGKSFILGYTNEVEGIFNDVPAIIFDDFTTAFHYVDFPFKVKSSAMKILKVVKEKADLKYLFYKMQTISIDKDLHKRYWISKYSQIQIPLPSLEQQKKTAEILDTAHQLREYNKQLIEKYDTLTQSLFLDMFGDPVRNEKDWEIIKMEEISLKITDGTHQSPKFLKNGIPFLLVSNIVNNKIIYKTNKYISEEDFEVLNKRTPIEIGNILITSVGSYGNPAIIESETRFAFQRHIAFIKPNHKLINYRYLFETLKSNSIKREIDKKVKGAAQKTYNLIELKCLKIINPPITLQDQFAERVLLIEIQKQQAQEALAKSEDLFQSLLQRAFKGELN
nr:restriction endonuclease subunit S [uncultured Flavobacterium sp.]